MSWTLVAKVAILMGWAALLIESVGCALIDRRKTADTKRKQAEP